MVGRLAVGGWRLAVGGWRLAVGGWRLAVRWLGGFWFLAVKTKAHQSTENIAFRTPLLNPPAIVGEPARLAKGWQKVCKRLAKGWQKVGKRLAKGWQKNVMFIVFFGEVDKRLAKGWQKVGKRLAKGWQKVGKRLAK